MDPPIGGTLVEDITGRSNIYSSKIANWTGPCVDRTIDQLGEPKHCAEVTYGADMTQGWPHHQNPPQRW